MITALYERLSQEDGTEESMSIRNQKTMLEEYARNHGYVPFRHFTDDGYTGANFHRPGFRAMMELAERGEIERIIVKDLSRFGRNYLKTGFYVDVLFPELNIHFVAVQSHADSRSGRNQDYVPFINIMNDVINRELSKKMKAVRQYKRERGMVQRHLPPYGYRTGADPARYEVDEEAAEVVREIFRLRLEGRTMTDIARELSRRKVSTRAWHIYVEQRGLTEPPVCHPGRDPAAWTLHSVRGILTTEEYTGVRLLGKYRNREPRRARPYPDPVRLPDQHEAIISREQFDRVQESLRWPTERRDRVRSSDWPLGVEDRIFCPICGENLRLWVEDGKPVYVCLSCRKNRVQPRLKLHKKHLSSLLINILRACWSPAGYWFPEEEEDPLSVPESLLRVYEKSISSADFRADRKTAAFRTQMEERNQANRQRDLWRQRLLQPDPDLYSLALFSRKCFWETVLPEMQDLRDKGMRKQEVTIVTLFHPEDALPWDEERQCYVVEIRKKNSRVLGKIVPAEDAPSLKDRLRICWQEGLLPEVKEG